MWEAEPITPHVMSRVVNWVCSRIFPAVNVGMEMGLDEISWAVLQARSRSSRACSSWKIQCVMGNRRKRGLEPCGFCPEKDKLGAVKVPWQEVVPSSIPSHPPSGAAWLRHKNCWISRGRVPGGWVFLGTTEEESVPSIESLGLSQNISGHESPSGFVILLCMKNVFQVEWNPCNTGMLHSQGCPWRIQRKWDFPPGVRGGEQGNGVK